MDRLKPYFRVFLIIFLLAAPAVLQRVASEFINDPYLRPLDMTLEDFSESGAVLGQGPWIEVDIAWGQGYRGQLTREQVKGLIVRALSHHTKRYGFVYRDVPGTGVGISFRVGSSQYGPYPPGGMVRGIDTALIAFRMASAQEPERIGF